MRLLAALVVVLVALPQLALAGPVFLRTTAYAQSGNSYFDDQTNDFVYEVLPGCSVEGTTIATCSLVVPFTPPAVGFGTAYSYQFAEATAAFGTLHGEVFEYGEDGGASITGYTLIATAEATDMITLTGGTGTGYLQYLFSGTLNSASSDFGNPDASSSFQFGHNGTLIEAANAGWLFGGGPVSGNLDYGFDPNGIFPYPFSYSSAWLPFTWGQPFEFSMYGRAMTQILFDGGGNGQLEVTLNDIRVRGSSARIMSTGSYQVTAVPEPTSLLLMSSGLAAAAWKRRRLIRKAV